MKLETTDSTQRRGALGSSFECFVKSYVIRDTLLDSGMTIQLDTIPVNQSKNASESANNILVIDWDSDRLHSYNKLHICCAESTRVISLYIAVPMKASV